MDTAIGKGLFNNSEAVVQMVSSFEYIMAIVRKSEGDNSERLMPGKSNSGQSITLSDENHDHYFPDQPKRVKQSEMPH